MRWTHHATLVGSLLLSRWCLARDNRGIDETCETFVDGRDGSCKVDTKKSTETRMAKESLSPSMSLPETNGDSGDESDNRHVEYDKLKPPVDGSDLGEPQTVDKEQESNISMTDIEHLIETARRYMVSKELESKKLHPEILQACRNEHTLCAMWSLQGECEVNPRYMKMNCGPVCESCEYLSIEGRCKMEDAGPEVWKPGDLDRMFQRISGQPFRSTYSVQILSSPETNDGAPWVVTLENVLSADEAEKLIELGTVEGYTRSLDVGEVTAAGAIKSIESSTRTSTNAWCQSDDCYKHEIVQTVTSRISDMVQIPEENSEYFQILRYEPGQFYGLHHDYIEIDYDRQPGVRILTVYLYLNDVDEGGGTNFSFLNITVMPKRGRALLWPSVLNDEPSTKDDRTSHQALPVVRGVKFGANLWYHLRNYKIPDGDGCI